MPIPKDTNETFIKKARLKWAERYDYSRVRYVNSRTPVTIICRKHHHAFKQTPKAHFSAKHHCCPLCYQEAAGSYQNKWREQPGHAPLESPLPPIINQVLREIAPPKFSSIKENQ